ncbi:uncharacterized protein M6B38_318165 [Iris pallida]|uniref:Uncharacterized protein n=1 Tax=Iris pallida TaxID=29817 RepID=A0AAX6HCU8_IRIPA|nr:uncharacterized protein M6B38_318165 [Iris pallida]
MESSLYYSSSSSVLSLELHSNPTRLPKLRRRSLAVRSATRRDRSGDGRRSVDESMIVLRRRMEEVRARELRSRSGGEAEAGAERFEWTEWEKEYYAGSYGSDVCRVVGFMQSALLTGTRPTVAVALLAALLLSVPTSVALLGFHLLDALRSVLTN